MGTIETIDPMKEGDIRGLSGRFIPVGAFSNLVIRLGRLVDRGRQRRDLLELTDEQLRDIGVTAEEARREAARPFWD